MKMDINKKITRKKLFKDTFTRYLPALMLADLGLQGCSRALANTDSRIDGKHIHEIREAMWYQKLANNVVKCELCPRQCVVGPGRRGECGVRMNTSGRYETLVFGNACTSAVDPIEKKPFFHFLPGQNALSLATAGCNFHCKFCQNWQISQSRPEDLVSQHLPPEELVKQAKANNIPAIAFTYSEPVVFSEYVLETAKLAKTAGLKTIVISNGFINSDPLKELCRYIDGYKVDLKGFSDEFYNQICSGQLQPVLKTLENLNKNGTWTEIVHLVIPTLNDKENEIKAMSKWIKENLGKDVPLHFSRFHPDYKLQNLPMTPEATLNKLYQIAKAEGLNYVYVGNLPGHPGENTYCPGCSREIIKRIGYSVKSDIINGKCPYCGHQIAGVWS